MKKICLFLFAALLVGMISVPASAAGKWYSLTEIEKAELSGLQIEETDGASGGKTVFADSIDATKAADERDYFEFTVNAPKAGSYAVWLRAYVLVGGADQATLYHRSNSALRASQPEGNPLWKMVGVDDGPKFVWYPLDVRMKNNAEPVITKTVELEKGENVISLGIRSLTSWESTHYYDCIIITDDTAFDPNTDDWQKLCGAEVKETTKAAEKTTAAPETTVPVTTAAEETTSAGTSAGTEESSAAEESTGEAPTSENGTTTVEETETTAENSETSEDTAAETEEKKESSSFLVPAIIIAAGVIIAAAVVALILKKKQ